MYTKALLFVLIGCAYTHAKPEVSIGWSATSNVDEVYHALEDQVYAQGVAIGNAYNNAVNSIAASWTNLKEKLNGTKDRKRREELESLHALYEQKIITRKQQGQEQQAKLQRQLAELEAEIKKVVAEKDAAVQSEIEDVNKLYGEYQNAVEAIAKKKY